MSKTEPMKRHVHAGSAASEHQHVVNQFLRILFWYIVLAVVAFIAVRRLISVFKRNWSALLEVLYRSFGYRQMGWTTGWRRYLSPPPVGEILFLCGYWIFLLLMLWTSVIFKSQSPIYGIELEVVGNRAAWVSTTQLPLVYCTGCRINPISLLTGISHERLNWFHRWAARTVFVSLIVHWAFFYREWDLTNFVQQEIEIMPMVVWGFAAWGMFGFMVMTSFGFFRNSYYEIWLLVHVLSAYLGLWLTYTHTHCTTFFVLASVGFIAFDLLGRTFLWTMHNLHPFKAKNETQAVGYNATVRLLDDKYIHLSVRDVSFGWKAGQHIYITVPHLRKVESHPFTIASLPVFLNGPYGNPPQLAGYDTVVLIATGNRASFILPLFQELVSTSVDVPRIYIHLVSRTLTETDWYLAQISASLKSMRLHRTEIEVQGHFTSCNPSEASVIALIEERALHPSAAAVNRETRDRSDRGKTDCHPEDDMRQLDRNKPSMELDCGPNLHSDRLPSIVVVDTEIAEASAAFAQTSTDSEDEESEDEKHLLDDPLSDLDQYAFAFTQLPSGCSLHFSLHRPAADDMIRAPVSEARGRVLVVAAVAGSLRSQIATCVSLLNREIIRPALNEDLDVGPISLELWCEVNGD
ncbi:Ferric reduct-domain-containing protein [Fonsecaea pedrosoi]|nr:Ferric reduct-domain-containing protein [Fonsecaea pedrosoi]